MTRFQSSKRENKRSHSDCISPFLAAEGTMHVRISLLALLIVSIGSGSAESPQKMYGEC